MLPVYLIRLFCYGCCTVALCCVLFLMRVTSNPFDSYMQIIAGRPSTVPSSLSFNFEETVVQEVCTFYVLRSRTPPVCARSRLMNMGFAPPPSRCTQDNVRLEIFVWLLCRFVLPKFVCRIRVHCVLIFLSLLVFPSLGYRCQPGLVGLQRHYPDGLRCTCSTCPSMLLVEPALL